MANEIEWQRRVIKQVVKEGGYGKKWATPYTVGVPDLILSLPDFGAAFVEVKLESNWDKNTSRKIALTQKQNHELNMFRDAGATVGVLLVVENDSGSRMSLLRAPPPRATIQVPLDSALSGAYEWRHRGQRTGFTQWMKKRLT